MYRYISISLVGAIGLSSLGPTRVPVDFGCYLLSCTYNVPHMGERLVSLRDNYHTNQ